MTKRIKRSAPRVALIIETSLAYGRGLLRGIARYVRENEPWSVYLEQRSLYDPAPEWLDGWHGDGIISRASFPSIAESVVELKIPTMDLNEEVSGLGLPLICNDNAAIGKVAAEHLLERGFKQFGFLDYTGINWSHQRRTGFTAHIEAQQYTCNVFEDTFAGPGEPKPAWESELAKVANCIT